MSTPKRRPPGGRPQKDPLVSSLRAFGRGGGGGRSLSRPVVQPRRRHRQCPHRPGLSAPDFNPQRAAELQIPFDKAARAYPYPGEIAGARERITLAQTKEVTP